LYDAAVEDGLRSGWYVEGLHDDVTLISLGVSDGTTFEVAVVEAGSSSIAEQCNVM
jgi:hypothetical protein